MSDEPAVLLSDVEAKARDLFAAAVAQGMRAPFALDCDYWGREYAERLVDALDPDD